MIQETGPNHLTSLYIYTDQNSYEPLARIDTDGNQEQHIRYFHTDLNCCPEELTDANGKILWECSFQLWGKRIHEIEHESVEQNLRYQGQYLDRETGLHYNTFRYYDPDIGRFTQPDPIGLAGGLNLYQYAPNGLTWIDPWGLSKKCMGVKSSGHHVPAVRKSKGRTFEVSRSDKTRPTLFPKGKNPEHDHWRLHNAEREIIGPRQGDFIGSDKQLFDAYRKAYSGLDDIKVDVKSPNGTYNLGTNVTPSKAVDLMESWLKEQGLMK
ncbi:RHS repeat domain-containing protein [Snodgrassella alvi]|uniref:RHS repeat domain-containing protein n=1 Tax=Snodgrassella alvi TaxID=1196083 RepID=UPI000CAA4809|nr:RHS repeat-associated core domain-containing protein [Snodgrassella alvi]PIT14842.1 hypothetical protein BGI33_07275 [Snodgrassella alvi]PIT20857.1 hypothetical protein BGI34_01955 [Snodgrassella alvi]